MPHPGGHCEDPGFSSEQDGSHWRILSKGLMKLPYVLTGLLGLLICKHPERDTGGCAEINKEPATIIEMIVAGGGGGGRWWDVVRSQMHFESRVNRICCWTRQEEESPG